MKKVAFLGLVLAFGTACGDAAVSGTAMGPSERPVSGTEARQWDLCSRIGDIGRSCSEACFGGGERIGRFECRHEMVGRYSWQCVTRESTTCVGAPQPPPRMDPPTRLQGRVVVTCSGPESREVLTDSGNAHVRTMRIEARGRQVYVRRIPAQIGWSSTGFPARIRGAELGSRYFNNLSVRDGGTTEILTEPVGFVSSDDNRSGNTVIHSTFPIMADSQRTLRFEVAVAAQEERYRDFTSGYFALNLGDGRNLRSIFSENDLVYGDTGENVPESDVTYDANCFETPNRHEFRVIPRFADLVVDRGRLAVSSTVIGNAGGVAMLHLRVINDGHEEGSMSETVLEANVRGNGIPVFFQPFVTRCDLKTLDNRTLGYGSISENRLRFSGVDARVPGRGSADFMVRCDVVWPTELATAMSTSSYEIRLGALYNEFRMTTAGDPGRIQGTLVLDQNRLWSVPDAVTVTLRPFGS